MVARSHHPFHIACPAIPAGQLLSPVYLGRAPEVVGDLPEGAIRQPACCAHCRGTVLDHPLQLPSRHQVGTPALAGEPSCLQVQAPRAVLRVQHEELPCAG